MSRRASSQGAGLRLILESKYRLVKHNESRIRRQPNPRQARRRFDEALRWARIVNRARIAFYALAYFGAVAAVVGFILARIAFLGALERVVDVAAGIASSLAVLALLGILACNRYLVLVDIQLQYHSREAAMVAAHPNP